MESSYREGQFVWRELMTNDVEKSRAFYTGLLGWTATDMPMPMGTYIIFKVGDKQVGGMMQVPPDKPMPSAWMSYVSVKDVDAAVKVATGKGGAAIMAGEDIPEVGRIAVLLDSTGAAIGIMRAAHGDGPRMERPVPGTFCWETLNTTDVDKAKDFYTAVIGWTTGASPGNMLVMSAGDCQVADFESAPPGLPSHWLLHVLVEKLEPARALAEKLGAKILMPAVDIPKVGRICVISDPAGAAISLFEPDMSSMPAA